MLFLKLSYQVTDSVAVLFGLHTVRLAGGCNFGLFLSLKDCGGWAFKVSLVLKCNFSVLNWAIEETLQSHDRTNLISNCTLLDNQENDDLVLQTVETLAEFRKREAVVAPCDKLMAQMTTGSKNSEVFRLSVAYSWISSSVMMQPEECQTVFFSKHDLSPVGLLSKHLLLPSITHGTLSRYLEFFLKCLFSHRGCSCPMLVHLSKQTWKARLLCFEIFSEESLKPGI